MNVSDLIQTVESLVLEVRGQAEENGTEHPQFKEAVRQLAETVSWLNEVTNGE